MRLARFVLFAAIGFICTAILPNAQAQYIYNRADFPIATGPGYDVAIGDFNEDGIPDLAVVMGAVEGTPGKVSILLGKPNGTFGPHTDYPLGAYSTHILTGDFNGDGKLDLAVLNRGDTGNSNVSILLGNGDGTFQPQMQTLLGTGSMSVTYMLAGDFNGDGKLDLVASLMEGQLEVLLGNGDGTFGAPIATQATTDANAYQIWYFAVGDFNKDGKVDVAVSLFDISTSARSVAILLGKGDGTFQSPADYAMVNNNDLVVADVNHDGILDLVGDGEGVSVLLGNSDGTFQAEIASPYGKNVAFLVVGDFNGDGNQDVAAVGDYSASYGTWLQTFLGDGKGHFNALPATTALPYNNNIPLIIVGDLNGDGVLDLVTGGPSCVSVLLGNGDGTMSPAGTIPNIAYLASAVAADFNGDGKPDLAIGDIIGGVGSLDIRLGNGNGTFAQETPFSLSGSATQVVAADFNGDGKPDLAALLEISVIQVALGNGDGTFRAGPQLAAENGDNALLAADFNGDGKTDLLVGGSSSPARLLLGNGDGTFQSPIGSIDWVTGQTGQLIAADFNHDGKMDIAATTNNANTLKVFLGNGDGTFQPAITYTTDFNPSGLVAADLNGDGKLDLAVATMVNGINIFLGNGDGTFQPFTEVSSSPFYADWVITGDFNGDGKIDLAAGFAQFGILYILPGNGDGTFSGPISFSIPPGPQDIRVTADFNGDGTDGVLFGSGSLMLWNGAPLLAIQPSALDFGGVAVGSSSEPQAVDLWDVGTAPLNLESLSSNGDFSETNDCGNQITVAGQCSVNVTFTPTGGGLRNGTLVVSDNATIHEDTVGLLGTGTGLSVAASPASLSFGSVMVGATASPQTVTFANTGSVGLSLSDVAVTGPFAIASSGTTCPTSGIVAPNASCTVAVTFTPAAGGQASGSLSFSDNAEGSPQSVSLYGKGLDFTLAAASGSTTSATVSAGGTATYSLTLTATAGFSTLVNLTCGGAPSLATCTVSPSVVTPNGSATAITVTVATGAGSSAPVYLRHLPGGSVRPECLWTVSLLLLLTALAAGLTATTRHGTLAVGVASIRKKLCIVIVAAIMTIFALELSGCGGGGPGGGGGRNTGTPPGTYTLTLTGTATSGGTVLSHDLNLILTVN